MTGIAAALLLAQTRAKVDAPTLEFYQERFVVRTTKSVSFVPIRPQRLEPKMAVAFRRNEDYAVWDERGLTVRHGNRIRTTRLEDVPLSGRLFSRPEIRENARLIQSGQRRSGASALSGAARLGRDAYFLVRWEDSKRRPWAEYLVRVSLEGKNVWPEVVGRFEGASLGYKPIDDRLFVMGGALAVVTRQERAWGLATFEPARKRFEFHPLGDNLLSFMPTGRKTALYVERTAYGLTQAGRIDVGSGQRVPVFEARSNARFLDTLRPYVVVASTQDSARVHNAETGAGWSIPLSNGVGRAGDYVVVWSPSDAPKTATLFRPDRWTAVATWKAK